MTAPLPAPPLPVLTGTRCRLRDLQPADAPSLQHHADDEGVWRNLFEGFPRPYTLDDAQAWCGGGSRAPAMGRVWGIEAPGDAGPEVVGCIGLRPDSGWLRCNAEVGYWIGRTFWRRGICGEALGLVRDWAWANLPELTRLYAPIYAWNEGSQAVAHHAGFQLEARMPQSAIKAGQVIDRVVYAQYRARAPQDMPPGG